MVRVRDAFLQFFAITSLASMARKSYGASSHLLRDDRKLTMLLPPLVPQRRRRLSFLMPSFARRLALIPFALAFQRP